MICRDETIKEMLPLYAEETLDESGMKLAETHLAACADCRAELTLLRVLAAEPVPDPGQAFWDAMPGRVFRAMQEQQTKRGVKGWDLSRLRLPLMLPRWSWAAASLAVALVFSWVIMISGIRNETSDVAEYQELAMQDAADTGATVNMTELSGGDLDAVNTWASQELTQIAREVQTATPSTSLLNLPDDLYEELADLTANEMDRFNGMLKEYNEEG